MCIGKTTIFILSKKQVKYLFFQSKKCNFALNSHQRWRQDRQQEIGTDGTSVYLLRKSTSPTGRPSICYDPSERHLRPVPIIPWGGKVISEHLEGDTGTGPRRYRNDRKVTPSSKVYILLPRALIVGH